MGWKMAGGDWCAIAVRMTGCRDEYLNASAANTIRRAALDMMRTPAAAVNLSRRMATIQFEVLQRSSRR